MGNAQYEINYSTLSKINSKLLYVTSAQFDTDWHSIMHTHPFTELFYVLKGKGTFHVEDRILDVTEDDLVIVNSNINHTESSNGESPLEYIVLGIEGISILAGNNDDEVQLYSLHNYENYKHEILFYIKTLLQEASTKTDYYDLISQNLLDVLIMNIIRRTKSELIIETSNKISHECAYVKQYLDQHFSENINLDELAKISYINKYYLVHSFKKYAGMTPINYLNHKRLKEACMLLRTTNHSIAQIASIIGMSSQSYFCQSFKKQYQMSPNEYRKESQSKEN